MKQIQQTKHVLGSDGVLTVVMSSQAAAQTLLNTLWKIIAEFEDRFSRFLPDSELTSFNHQAGKTVPVSADFVQLLQSMKHWSATTDGLYNPFILPALQRAGYVGSWPTPSAGNAATYYIKGVLAKGEQIFIADNAARIPAHTALDAGGIGKGYLLDMLAEQAHAARVHGFWFSLGGDIICAGTNAAGKPWQVGVQRAGQSDAVGFFAAGASGTMAVATSGTIKRGGVKDGKRWHHIIDPRTNESAETDILTATVVHKQGVAADVLAKCLVIIGSAQAHEFCHRHGVQAFLQLEDRTVHVTPEGTTHDFSFTPAR